MRIPLLALVALTEDIPSHRQTRGQIDTVVEHLKRDRERALLVEFSDERGQTYAMVPVRPEHLLVLTGIPKRPSVPPLTESPAPYSRPPSSAPRYLSPPHAPHNFQSSR
jgi:hypothetical protein